MSDDKLVLVKAWFRKAENDLINAEHTMTMAEPPTDTVCFHAQQCAEKYLKGFLAYHSIDFPKTHSLEDLVVLAKAVAPSLQKDAGEVEILSSYGVEARYPDAPFYDIPKEDAWEAIKMAKQVKDAVVKLVGPLE